MGLGDITTESVLRALKEHDRLGGAEFQSTYGFTAARRYPLTWNGQTYDSRAIIGVAHGYATGTFWRARDIPGVATTVVHTLQRLGFDARDTTSLPQPDKAAVFGEVPGYPEGSTFSTRAAAHAAGVHRPTQAGICGRKTFGAESIVVSGGYEDDQDLGDVIIYTGHGGQNDRNQQVADQTFDDPGNAALLTSSITGGPVRVIRGAHRGSPHAPESGYRYDGLFRVVDAWQQNGVSGHQVCRYKLVKVTAEPAEYYVGATSHDRAAPDGTVTPERQTVSVQRIIRSTAVSQYVKRLHNDTCQACAIRLVLAGRGYSEGAHIRPLGRGHNGPDIPSNVLCLCPNCHTLFDNGALVIDENWQVHVNGKPDRILITHESHAVDSDHLAYHRNHYGNK
jgi:predicted restriction endonuclease